MAPKTKKVKSSTTNRSVLVKDVPKSKKSTRPVEEAAIDSDLQAFEETISIIDDLKRQLEHSWKLNRTFQEEIEGVRAEKSNIETLAVTRAQEIENQLEELGKMQTSNERLMVELGASEEERSEAVREIARLRNDNQDKKETITFMTGEVTGLEESLAEAEQQVIIRDKSFMKKIKEINDRMEKLEDRLDKKTRELYQAEVSIEDLSIEKHQLDHRVATLEKSRAALTKIHGSLKGIQSQVLQAKV